MSQHEHPDANAVAQVSTNQCHCMFTTCTFFIFIAVFALMLHVDGDGGVDGDVGLDIDVNVDADAGVNVTAC